MKRISKIRGYGIGLLIVAALVFVLVSCTSPVTEPTSDKIEIVWQKLVGKPDINIHFYSCTQLADGNYVAVGTAYTDSFQISEGVLHGFSATGTDKPGTFYYNQKDGGWPELGIVHTDTLSTLNYDFIVVGMIGPDESDLYNGHLTWFKKQQDTDNYIPVRFQSQSFPWVDTEGSFNHIIVAQSNLLLFGDYVDGSQKKLLVYKLDLDGNPISPRRSFDTFSPSYFAQAFVHLEDGSFLLAGNELPSGNVAVAKLTPSLDVSLFYAGAYAVDAAGFAVAKSSNGRILFVGKNGYKGFIIKLQSNGTYEGVIEIDGDSTSQVWLTSVCATSDEGFFVAGFVRKSTGNELLLIRIDSDGNIEWQETLKLSNKSDEFYSIMETADDAYILLGRVFKSETNKYHGFIMKFREK